MIEMSSGLGATTMGMGVNHGTSGGGEGVTDGCRIRTTVQGQQQQQQQSPINQQSQSQTSNQQLDEQEQSSQGIQSQQNKEQQGQQQRQNVGHAGRSKKDNCCLCWCCCCSCSNKCLAAVGTNGNNSGVGEQGKKRGNSGGLVGTDFSSGGHGGDFTSTGGNDIDGIDGVIECCGLDEVRSWGTSFDKLMKSSGGRKIFREFLISEYSEENIAFWLACEQLKREKHPDKIEEKARFIYEDYISILSPKEVSLDSRVREIVNKNMVEPSPHSFDEAQLQIYTLMHRDSYPRFINSEIFRRVARLGSGPPSPTNPESDHGPPVGKIKSKRSIA
ncbi:regulator of G-protein signaling 17 isoform X2 [Aphidius gifuensis]|uniref:regulator of G-protein signaling 17 isoform X2 n=1 Tax=Aphidius gifuensis TaxID=684658 RepID=UPI001CDC49D0|nr:regulator of G-protein signaling 17 isoform X2 [Aphidius gifuensis]